MTKAEAQIVLLRAFVATGELPNEIENLLLALISEAEPATVPESPANDR